MKCPNCDFKIEEGAGFCPKCGCPLEIEEVVETVKEQQEFERKIKTEKEIVLSNKNVNKKKVDNSMESKLNTLIWIGWGLLAIGIMQLIAFLDFSSYYKGVFY